MSVASLDGRVPPVKATTLAVLATKPGTVHVVGSETWIEICTFLIVLDNIVAVCSCGEVMLVGAFAAAQVLVRQIAVG